MHLKLFHYWRSSSSWRVRWALEFKNIKAEMIPINLLNGESESSAHLARHPMGYVPVLEIDSRFIIQSVAIIDLLEEKFPQHSLFPGDLYQRAHIRALCEIINADTQPIQNLSVMEFHSSDSEKQKLWNQHFIKRGLQAFEDLAKPFSGKYSVGNQITAADLFLVPQCYNALRFGVDLTQFPLLKTWYENALLTEAAQNSAPEKYQP